MPATVASDAVTDADADAGIAEPDLGIAAPDAATIAGAAAIAIADFEVAETAGGGAPAVGAVGAPAVAEVGARTIAEVGARTVVAVASPPPTVPPPAPTTAPAPPASTTTLVHPARLDQPSPPLALTPSQAVRMAADGHEVLTRPRPRAS